MKHYLHIAAAATAVALTGFVATSNLRAGEEGTAESGAACQSCIGDSTHYISLAAPADDDMAKDDGMSSDDGKMDDGKMDDGMSKDKMSKDKMDKDKMDKDKMSKDKMGDKKDVVATATAAGQFKTLTKALKATGLDKTLEGDGPFTVFAPTDAAFDALPDGALDSLMADKEALKKVLLYHVVSGQKVTAAAVMKLDGENVETANGNDINISVKDGQVYLNGDVKVVKTDISASNGVIHAIDHVLLP